MVLTHGFLQYVNLSLIGKKIFMFFKWNSHCKESPEMHQTWPENASSTQDYSWTSLIITLFVNFGSLKINWFMSMQFFLRMLQQESQIALWWSRKYSYSPKWANIPLKSSVFKAPPPLRISNEPPWIRMDIFWNHTFLKIRRSSCIMDNHYFSSFHCTA